MASGLSSLNGYYPGCFGPPEQTAAHWYRQRRARRRLTRQSVSALLLVPVLMEMCGSRNLINTFEELKRTAGRAPGLDGIRYDDISKPEMAAVLRVISRAIENGTYRPHPCRVVPIPKSGGGTRKLRLRIIADRVVSAALHNAFSPFWEGIFHPRSHGWRPRRGVLTLLAELRRDVDVLNYKVLAIDDVEKAFDNLVIEDVLADHARHIDDDRLLQLIGRVLQGHDPERAIGVDQGSAYSPDALNLRMTHAHDLPVFQGHHPSGYRYGDNLAYPCRGVSEGHQVLAHVGSLLGHAGLKLKGEDAGSGTGPVVDLQQKGKADLLGFQLFLRQGRLAFDLADKAWSQLHEHLVKAHEAESPSQVAHSVVLNWLTAYAPAFESLRADTCDRVIETASQLGFREIPSRKGLEVRCRLAWSRWESLYQRVLSAPVTCLCPIHVAAPLATANADGAR
jgi:Reverse transcriptase (RNA-dependent DNA polymerase)